MSRSDSVFACQVSVVMPAYRVTEYIAQAIDSVLAQTFRDFELIVINDGCPDTVALEQVLKPYASRIVYLKHETNAGLSAARNTGIRCAHGEFIALLDADDVYEPQYLEVQLRKFREHPEAHMIYGSSLIFGDDPSVGMPIEAFRPSSGPVTPISLLQEKVTVSVLSVIRRDILFQAGLFDEEIRKCEDFDLWLRMTKLGACILYHSEPIARYRIRRDSLSADKMDMFTSLIAVASKFEQRGDLTQEELRAAAEARVRWSAESDLQQGKRYFRQKNYRDSAIKLRNANRYFKRQSISFAAAALTWVPGLVMVAIRFRDMFFSLRTMARGTR